MKVILVSRQERIKIITTTETRVNGKPVKREFEFYKCWAGILDLIGNELYKSYEIGIEEAIIFKIRYCKLLEKLRNYKNFYVIWNDTKYQIYQADFMGNSKKYIKLKCKSFR